MQLKRLIQHTGAWLLAAGCAVLFTGCASTSSTDIKHSALLPWHRTAPVEHAGLDPVLPPAGSGRGAYYQDDGPGANPPPRLHLVPDAMFKIEPYTKSGNRPYSVFGALSPGPQLRPQERSIDFGQELRFSFTFAA